MRILFKLLILAGGLIAQTTHAACVGVGCSCTASSNNVVFGAYDPKSNTDKTISNGFVRVSCSAVLGTYSVSYVIALSTGTGTYTTRILTDSGHTINYNLYTPAGFTVVWGDGTNSSSTVSDAYTSLLSSEQRDYTINGMIPKLQNAFVGSNYTDSITATVTY